VHTEDLPRLKREGERAKDCDRVPAAGITFSKEGKGVTASLGGWCNELTPGKGIQ